MRVLTLITSLALTSLSFTNAQAETAYTATGSAAVASAAATALTRSPTSNVQGKAFDRFVVIWNENTDYDKAIGDPNLAWLAKKGITLSSAYAVTHPSEPNYVSSHGGDYFGMDNDDFNRVPKNVSTVIDLLESKGISWAEYQEDMPYSGFEGKEYLNQQNGANDYVRKHNPAVIYDNNAASYDRLSQMKNLTMFYQDLKEGTLPQWMFITPNMTSDGHDTSVTVAGAWTRNFLEPLLEDEGFMNNTLVLVTFDENETYSIENRILGILIGDAVPEELVGTEDDTYYNHYSEIATVEANWDLPTLGRFDVGANVYKFVADKTGDEVREWSDTPSFDEMNFNFSYPGMFNSKTKDVLPAPNVDLVYAGRMVYDGVKAAWNGSESVGTYYTDALEIPDGYHLPQMVETDDDQ